MRSQVVSSHFGSVSLLVDVYSVINPIQSNLFVTQQVQGEDERAVQAGA